MLINNNDKLYGIGISNTVRNRLTIWFGYQVFVFAPRLFKVYRYKTREESKPKIVYFFGFIKNCYELDSESGLEN